MHKDIGQLMDEMIEVEKAVQKENARWTELEKQIFEALGKCDFGKVNELLVAMDDDIYVKLNTRFDQLKQEAKVLMKNIKMP